MWFFDYLLYLHTRTHTHTHTHIYIYIYVCVRVCVCVCVCQRSAFVFFFKPSSVRCVHKYASDWSWCLTDRIFITPHPRVFIYASFKFEYLCIFPSLALFLGFAVYLFIYLASFPIENFYFFFFFFSICL